MASAHPHALGPQSILLNDDGKQLTAEVPYLYGCMLLLLERLIPGVVRERLLIAYLRLKGQADLHNIDNVCALFQRTGYDPQLPTKRPEAYPEAYFNRDAAGRPGALR